MPTGFCDLDKRLDGGLRGGWLAILAARPSIGKTALAGNIALHAARSGEPVLICSMEQTRIELAERFLSSISGIPASDVKINNRENLPEADQNRILKAQSTLVLKQAKGSRFFS